MPKGIDTKNKNLLIAEKLLLIINRDEKKFLNTITIEPKDFPKLTIDEIVDILKRLEERKLIKFEDEDDKYDTYNLKYIHLSYNKKELDKFIKISKNKYYGLLKKYSGQNGRNYILETLTLILKFKTSKGAIDFANIGNKYKEICLWLADYSGAIKILYKNEPDVEFGETKRPQILGISEVPTKFIILNVSVLENLNNNIRKEIITPQVGKIKLLLKNNPEVDWRCAECKHFLKEKLNNEKQISDYLNNFRINKFKVCYKCRKENYFSINKQGVIKFLINKK
ncbi:MAG: hypothetical protein PHZ07_02110 [Patescibacteria group bacterium]|nr:hypothetical protein [Patescibacteria group bacterium]MDD4304022.1 hypothetical protein [Patescibacteria group bacterium]MDD4694899.1 hypothetical protein [Patescibacteria group bacterium]